MPFCSTFRLELEKPMAKFGTNDSLFGCFWDTVFKKYSFVYNFCVKVKMSKLRTKNTSFWYFWVKIWKNLSPI